jgi:thiol-disulfide isomerase/thioredoxin
MTLGGCGADAGLDQHGQKVPAEQLENQWLIINYWAEWCAPCRREIPELNGLAREWTDAEVGVFGVNFDGLEGPELARASSAMGIEFRVLAQDPAPRLGLPRSEVLPVTYIVDDRGTVRERLAGEQTADSLKAHLQRLRGN